jgi:hypothetical protein
MKYKYMILIVLVSLSSFSGAFAANTDDSNSKISVFDSLLEKFNSNGMHSVVVKLDKEQLRNGDIIYLEHGYGFCIFKKIEEDGSVLLQFPEYTALCSPQTFDHLYNGYALIIDLN